MVVEGERVIEGFRSLAGATDPTAASRARSAATSAATGGWRSSRTSSTAPTHPESAEREIGIWF